jgi:hypothetical protein
MVRSLAGISVAFLNRLAGVARPSRDGARKELYMAPMLDCLVSYYGLDEYGRPSPWRYFCYHVLAEGGKTSVQLATLPDDGPAGRYFYLGEPLPW